MRKFIFENFSTVHDMQVPTAEHKLVARTFERSDDETEKEEEQRQHYENLMNSFSSKRVARSSLLQPDRSDL